MMLLCHRLAKHLQEVSLDVVVVDLVVDQLLKLEWMLCMFVFMGLIVCTRQSIQ